MNLYKYLSADRVDVLRSGLIRFTQPRQFNDPFETMAYLLATTKRRKATALGGELGGLLRREARSRKPELARRLEVALKAEVDDSAVDSVADELINLLGNWWCEMWQMALGGELPEFQVMIQEYITQWLDTEVGLLCLTEKPDDLLMWAHYATGHTGFVIGFDSKHPFFAKESIEWKKVSNYFGKVQYTAKRPRFVLSKDEGQDRLVALRGFLRAILLTKSRHWRYEKEWRLIRALDEAKLCCPSGRHRIHLFELPPEIIQEVILGCRVADATRKRIEDALAKPHYAHVSLNNASVDGRVFKLNLINKRID